MKIIDILPPLKYALERLGITLGFMGFYLVLALNGYDMKFIIYFWILYILVVTVEAIYNSFIKPKRKGAKK